MAFLYPWNGSSVATCTLSRNVLPRCLNQALYTCPERPGTTGWLGRWLDTAGGDPRTAISLEPVLPPVLAGATSAGAAVARLSALPDDQLGREDQGFLDVVLRDTFNHLAHHRGQLTVYLRLMGAKVPALYGPSADDKSFG